MGCAPSRSTLGSGFPSFPIAFASSCLEQASDSRLTPLTAETAEGEETGLESLFREYLAERGTHNAGADSVAALFENLLGALANEQSIRLADLDPLIQMADSPPKVTP